MDSNLVTLGKRENAVFILTPLYLVLFYFFRQFYLMDESGLGLLLMILHAIGFIVAVVAVLRFFRRIILPSKILEYDSMNLYINRGLKGTQMISWTEVRSVDNLQVHGSIDAFIDAIRRITDIGEFIGILKAAWDLSATGVIVLNCKDEVVRVHGIKNAREVRNELHKIISSKRKNMGNSFRL
ncbi:MAG: hypothetical protein UGF89_05135 [Acutalibacteraceae bacterium]|nr:hypothetical protein [Acutalibacteraceae bacterium]